MKLVFNREAKTLQRADGSKKLEVDERWPKAADKELLRRSAGGPKLKEINRAQVMMAAVKNI